MSILNISVQNWTHENMSDTRVHAGVQASQVFKIDILNAHVQKLNTYTDVWCVQIQMFEHASGVKKVLQMLNAEYSPHSLVLQKTALTQTKTLTLMSVNKTWTQV